MLGFQVQFPPRIGGLLLGYIDSALYTRDSNEEIATIGGVLIGVVSAAVYARRASSGDIMVSLWRKNVTQASPNRRRNIITQDRCVILIFKACCAYKTGIEWHYQ